MREKLKYIHFWFKGIFFLFFLLFLQIAFSQHKDGIKAIESEAHKAYHAKNYEDALNYYLMIDSLQPNNADVNAHIGICYINLKSKYKSLPYLEKALSLGYHKGDYLYFMGRAYHYNHFFDKAISYYEKYKANTKNKENINEAIQLIQNCINGKEIIKSPVDVKIENLGQKVNSEFDDYAPVISADESILIFTSKRPNGGKKGDDGKFLEDMYISEKSGGQWSQARNMGKPVNTGVNDASIGLSMDGQQLFVYKNDTTGEDDNGGDVYVSDKVKGKWTLAKKLNSNINTDSWEPSANMSANEELLFFSSDKPGGYGGTDLYVSRRFPNNKGWGPAKNLGPIINTSNDEDAPFLHADGKTLYFSSRGHNSIGGFDVFTTVYSSENHMVTIPENIGYPINSADDELFFVWSADGKRGYFSSERGETFGGEDIYIIHRPNIKMDLILLDGKIHHKDKPITANITIIDNETNKIIGFYDSTKFNGDYTVILEPGKNYAVSIESKNFLSHSENINVPVNGFYKFQKDVEMTTLDKGGLIVLNNVFFENGKSDLRKESFGELDRYYDLLNQRKDLFIEIAGHAADYKDHKENLFLSEKRANAVVDYLIKKGMDPNRLRAVGYGDKFKIISDDKDEELRLNTRTELVIVERLKSGETLPPSKGFYYEIEKEKGKNNDDVLAIRREKTLKLITQEEQDRIEYGLASGEIPNKKSSYLVKKDNNLFLPFDSSAFKKENKERNEIKKKVKSGELKVVKIEGFVDQNSKEDLSNAVVKMVDDNGTVIAQQKTKKDGSYSFDGFNEKDKKYTIVVEKKGFFTQHIDVDVPANNGEKIVKVSKHLTLTKLEVGAIVVLRNIYFEFNKATLKKESFKELVKIEKVMKTHPRLSIEIAGYTDNFGPDYYNLILSQRRAQVIVDYLVHHGIKKERIVAKGYGEEKPIASNDDEIEGRELNRRIEFVVLDDAKK